jgi:mono/diheme cytochrome c family protein
MKGWIIVFTVPLAALLIAGAIGWEIGNSQAGDSGGPAPISTTTTATPVDPHLAAGAHNFVRFACSQCHGALGKGDVSPDVPALTTVGPTLTPAALRKIIDKGLGVVSDPKRPYMPPWGSLLSSQQVNDLVSYLHAGLPPVADATPVPVPVGQGDVVAGAALYERYGCINCHGPNALGGVPNPASPDKTIPPLSGADFRSEFNTDAKIADFIVTGSVLGKAPIASMPHWGGILPPAEVAQIVAYLKTLR